METDPTVTAKNDNDSTYEHPLWGKPDYVNEEGVQWWKMHSGGVWLTLHPDGEWAYLGIHNGEIVAKGQALDAVATRLYAIKLAEREFG